MNSTLRLVALAIISNLGFVSLGFGATYYVRSGASGGNVGTDWANAWTGLNRINYSAIQPGDTIYIAAGTYGSLSTGKSGTSGNPITFKRATVADHGTATGWSNSYDGRVIIDGGKGLSAVGINNNYITIDGATRYGIWLRNADYGVRVNQGGNDLTIRYLEIGDAGTYKMGEDGIQGSGNNLLVEHSHIHDNDNVQTHGDGIQWYRGTNIVMRYNLFVNNGQVLMLTETVWGNDYINDFSFYYNVIYNTGGSHYNGISKKLCPETGRYWRIYNNTWFLDANTSTNWEDDIFGGAGTCTRMEVKNNAFVKTRHNQLPGATHSFNAFDSSGADCAYSGTQCSAPSETGRLVAADLGFVNAAGRDFRLTENSPLIGAGASVGLVQDFDGRAVPSRPSIGAFEPGTATGPIALPAPTNLRLTP